MKIEPRMCEKYLLLIGTFLTCMGIVRASEEILIHVIAMLVFVLVAIAIVNFDFLHPYFWFSGFFLLYSVSFPLLCIADETIHANYSKEVIVLQLLALFVCLLIVGPKKRLNFDSLKRMKLNIGVFNKVSYASQIIIILIATFFVIIGGYSGKDEVYATRNPFFLFAFRIPLVLVVIYVISVISEFNKKRKLPMKDFWLTGVPLLLLTLFSGERDFIFRFIMLNIFLLYYFRKITLKHIILSFPIGMIVLNLSHVFKYYFLTGRMNNYSHFMRTEFISAARNLQTLINHRTLMEGARGYELILEDVCNSVLSSFVKTQSVGAWYNETFFKGSKVGYGFSLVGEGYVIDGWQGVIVLFIIVGAIIRIFYIYSSRNVFALTAYFCFVTGIVYSIRADLSTILAIVEKQILLIILLFIAMQRIRIEKPVKAY